MDFECVAAPEQGTDKIYVASQLRLRDKIDTSFEDIRLDYSCLDAYTQGTDEIRAALNLIIQTAQDALKLCDEIEALNEALK